MNKQLEAYNRIEHEDDVKPSEQGVPDVEIPATWPEPGEGHALVLDTIVTGTPDGGAVGTSDRKYTVGCVEMNEADYKKLGIDLDEEQTYDEFVKSRMKTGVDIVDDVLSNGMVEQASRLAAFVGLVGEIQEFRRANEDRHAIEELGDVSFYLKAAEQACGDPMQELYDDHQAQLGNIGMYQALDFAIQALEYAKKEFFHCKVVGAAMQREYVRCLAGIKHAFMLTVTAHGLTLEEVEELSRDKLTKRHPDGYTNEGHTARADKEGQADDVV